MSYVVLARKYRPQDFETLVGQNSVSQTLGNALISGRIAHAYVFSGPRGVGKTTTARILAKCLNCEKGTSLTPCQKCASCVAITQGTSMQDVLEIDGASNRGIEQIRDLRDNAKYAPTSSRYRIFIIDEAHQITKDAFGALLKTLEEPPSHVVFMMATTEVQKIPAPILSRCQRFSLRPISPELVFEHLKEICQKEKIVIEDSALSDIVRFVEGSLRDALSLLDQAIVYSPEGITSQTFRDLLGLLPQQLVSAFAKTIYNGEPTGILQQINQYVQNGVDLTQLAKDLEEYYHQILLTKAGVKDPLNQLNDTLKNIVQDYDYATLERSIRLLAKALYEMRNSETPRAVFEIAAIKLGQKLLDPKAILERLEKLELTAPVRARETSPSYSKPTSETAKTPSTIQPASLVKKISSPETPSAIQKSAPSDRSAFDIAQWATIANELGQKKFTLGTALDDAHAAMSGSDLVLTFSKLFHQQTVARQMDVLTQFVRERLGSCPTVQLRLIESPKQTPSAEENLPSPSRLEPVLQSTPENDIELEDVNPNQAGSDVQSLMKQFPGTLKRVKKGS